MWTPEFIKNSHKTGGINGQRQSWQWKRKQNKRYIRDNEIKTEAKMEEGSQRETRRSQEEKKVELMRNLCSAFQYIRNGTEEQLLEKSYTKIWQTAKRKETEMK